MRLPWLLIGLMLPYSSKCASYSLREFASVVYLTQPLCTQKVHLRDRS
jgi:hypothetical protein